MVDLTTILIPILTAASGYFGGYLSFKSKRIDTDSAFKFNLMNERGALVASVTSMAKDLVGVNELLVNEKVRVGKLKIINNRLRDRIECFVDLLKILMKAEECWEQGNRIEAQRLLDEVMNDPHIKASDCD